MFGLSNSAVCVVFLGDWKGEAVFDVFYSTYFFFVLTSIFHLAFIAVDRLYAIVRPIHHNIIVTRKRVYIALGVVWTMAIVVTLALYFSNQKGHLFKDEYGVELIADDNSTITNSSTMSSSTIASSTPTSTTSQTPTTLKSILLKMQRNKPSRRPQKNSSLIRKSKNSTQRMRKPRFRKKILKSKSEKYKTFMQELLSWFLIGADIFLVLVYTVIIYRIHLMSEKRAKMHNHANHHSGSSGSNKIGLVCFFVAAAYVVFTLPYALMRLLTGTATFWPNILLVSNSGLNSVIYFFRNWCERLADKRRRKKDPTSSSSGAFTPVATPLTSRHNVSDSVNNSPIINLKRDDLHLTKL